MLESTENLSDVNTATARVRIQQRPRRRSVTAQWRALDWVPGVGHASAFGEPSSWRGRVRGALERGARSRPNALYS